MSTVKKDDILESVEGLVRGVLADKDSTPGEKIQAATLGLKVWNAKNRISDPDEKEKSFFGGKK